MISDYNESLQWDSLDGLNIGEAYTLGVDSPLTYLLVGRYVGRFGRDEFDVTTLVGPRGRAATRTYWNPKQEVLVVPPEHVGLRLAHAADAFEQRERRGSDRISLGAECWPYCIDGPRLEEVPTAEDAEVVA